jgi:hypothetical protein
MSKTQAISTSFGSRVGKQSPTYASGAAITSFPPSTANQTPANGVRRKENSPSARRRATS